jgi:hypothetical protein
MLGAVHKALIVSGDPVAKPPPSGVIPEHWPRRARDLSALVRRRRIVGLRIATLALTMLLLSASASGASGSLRTFSDRGISFAYPSGWYATAKPLSNVTEPVYRFAVGNFRFHRTPRDLGPCLSGIAKQRPRNGVLAFVMEALGGDRRRSLPRTRARPSDISLPRRSDQDWCLGHGTVEIVFHAAGRVFYLGISVGPNASRGDKMRLHTLLNAMKIK